MGEIKELWCPSIEQLVCEIKAVNRAWKAASELFGEVKILKDLKNAIAS
ncbi:hypothetical protein ACF3DV_11210 [Chlorogloeopsis fritschii PCC 9212]|uniref:Uncharacterized protein n=1 Tax=Chlorogloeopsis fritschii PCC 6912 TaxID=211165 RepID=A0A3S0ZNR4_CHLFR|nr:hypothetical protein [Chlorogloeopsis fritschii]RUR76479.1 hypothetical protein PCC6912_42670 [Chlorogloeopsis fritschii PCC 6912]